MATMKEIAQLSGVSRGTVDRVLNNRGGVQKDTADRSSTTATVRVSAILLATSRSKVVLPQPGAPSIKIACPRSGIFPDNPKKSRATRMHRERGHRIPENAPSFTTDSPQTPMRCPPGAVRYPRERVTADQGEYRLAALIQWFKSSWVTAPAPIRQRQLSTNSGGRFRRRRIS